MQKSTRENAENKQQKVPIWRWLANIVWMIEHIQWYKKQPKNMVFIYVYFSIWFSPQANCIKLLHFKNVRLRQSEMTGVTDPLPTKAGPVNRSRAFWSRRWFLFSEAPVWEEDDNSKAQSSKSQAHGWHGGKAIVWIIFYQLIKCLIMCCSIVLQSPMWFYGIFPECVARVPVSFGGLGVRLCSRKVVSMSATVRNRSQPSATVCVSAVRLSTVASAPGVIPKTCEVESCRRSYIGVCRGGVWECDLWRRSYIGVRRRGVCVSALWRRSYFGVRRRGVCVSDLWRRSYIGVCRGVVSVIDLWRCSYIGVCKGVVCVCDLWRRSCIGVCRGGVCVSDLCHRSYIGLCSGGVCVSDLWRCSYIGVRRGGVCVRDLWRRSSIGVCGGGVCESDLWRCSYIGLRRGGVCVRDLWRRSSFYSRLRRRCLWVCESDLWRRNDFGVCRGGVCASDLCRRSYIGVCRGTVCVSDLWRRSVVASVLQECQVRSAK